MGVIVDAGRKSFGKTRKPWSFSSINSIFTLFPILYSILTVFIPVDFIYHFFVYNEFIDIIL